MNEKKVKNSKSYDVKLDAYEQEIEDLLDFSKMKSVKNVSEKIAELRLAAQNFKQDKSKNN